MTVKLVLLKSGEKLISDIKEGFIGENMICYLLEKPCTISVNGSYKILDEDDGGNKVSISLQSWPQFSNQQTIEMNPSWIVTLVEPSEEIKKMYETQVLGIEQNDETIGTDEQSDSNLTD